MIENCLDIWLVEQDSTHFNIKIPIRILLLKCPVKRSPFLLSIYSIVYQTSFVNNSVSRSANFGVLPKLSMPTDNVNISDIIF